MSSTSVENSRVLASCVQDVTEDLDVRGAAYDALLILFRRRRFLPKSRPFDPKLYIAEDLRTVPVVTGL
jgi:hypothetical protein